MRERSTTYFASERGPSEPFVGRTHSDAVADQRSEPPAAKTALGDFELTSPPLGPQTLTLPLSDIDLSSSAPFEFPGPGAGSAFPVIEQPVPEQPRMNLQDQVPASVEVSRSTAPAAGEFPSDLAPLGQIQNSFIVATNLAGLWIIDQHVAHERILFERHLGQCRDRKVEGQRLLLPIIVELSPGQEATLQEIAEELRSNGFEVEPFGQRTVAIKVTPAEIQAEGSERLLLEILDGVAREARSISLEELRGKIAASVACHAAIKINTPLERNKMQWLLRELARTDCPMTCPHGRPIVLRYSMKEIQKAFKRI
jgi:DNA mismatch repair protein MutL